MNIPIHRLIVLPMAVTVAIVVADGCLCLHEKVLLHSSQACRDPRFKSKPIPCGPDAATHSNYVVTVAHPFYLRHWLGPLNAAAYAQAPWKEDAALLLREETFGLAYGWTGAMANIRAKTVPLIERGCTCPAIRWMYAVYLEREKREEEARKLMQQLSDEVATNSFCTSPLKAFAAYGVMRLSSNETSEARLVDALATTLTDGSFKTNETRVAWDFLDRCDMRKNPRLLAKLDALGVSAIDPWFALMMRGQAAYDKAWAARGGGYASTVTEEGWGGYNTAIQEAQDCLTKAWERHPDIPDAAVLMIDCSRGNREACRMWFDRAVAAQMDKGAAYSSYRFTLRPRWGGSLSRMRAFAEECLNTQRFDTEVPLQYVMGLYDMADETKEGWQAIFQQPGAYEQCRHVLTNDLAKSFGRNWIGARYYNTALAYTACAVNDYDEAWRVFGNLRTPDGNYAFDNRIRPPPPSHDVMMTLIPAMNGPNKDALRAADKLARTGAEEEALSAFRALIESKRLTDDELDGASYWALELGKRQACAHGEWFSLIPACSTPYLDGPWISFHNSWTFSNQTFRTESQNGLLASNIALPRDVRYELAVAPINSDPLAPCYFGFSLDSKPGTTLEGPVLWLARNKGAWTTSWVRRFGSEARNSRTIATEQTLDLGATNVLHISVISRDNKVTTSVNGRQTCDNLDLSAFFYDTLRSGRLPYLFGSQVVLTEWRMRQVAGE